jgi:hypothetical protein
MRWKQKVMVLGWCGGEGGMMGEGGRKEREEGSKKFKNRSLKVETDEKKVKRKE